MFDAVIASNDDTAISVLKELNRRGIDVPNDVSVVGFDNIIESRISRPKLTTVDQRTYDQGWRAAEMLFALVTNKKMPELLILPTEPVFRQSCGCTVESMCKSKVHFPPIDPKRNEKLCEIDRSNVIKKRNFVSGTADHRQLTSRVQKIIKAVSETLNQPRSGALETALRNFTDYLAGTNVKPIIAHRLFYMLQSRCAPLVIKDASMGHIFEALSRAEERIVAYFNEKERARNLSRFNDELKIRELHASLQKDFDMKNQINAIYRGLKNLGFHTGYLSLYENQSAPLALARLLLAFYKKIRFPLKEKGILFPASELVPWQLLRDTNEQYTLIVSPLFYGREQLGFILYNFIRWEANSYENIRMILSIALKNASFFKKIEILFQNIKELEKNRKIELVEENDLLKTEVKKLQEIVTSKKQKYHLRNKDFRIQRALDYINDNYNVNISLEDVANKAFMAVTYFSKIFKKTVGKGYAQYIASLRFEKAIKLLRNPELTVREIAHIVGYPDVNYFYKKFKKYTGVTPCEYKKQA